MKINILSVFLRTLSTKQEYIPTILHILLKISINNHPLLYIHKQLPINNEINHINKEINLLQDLVKKKKK